MYHLKINPSDNTRARIVKYEEFASPHTAFRIEREEHGWCAFHSNNHHKRNRDYIIRTTTKISAVETGLAASSIPLSDLSMDWHTAKWLFDPA